MPKRIQRKRTRGWRMPEGAVYVGRPSRWGNPITPEAYWDAGYNGSLAVALRHCVDGFRAWLLGERHWSHASPMQSPPDISELRGKDLACWCPLPKDGEADLCHAAVLLELANTPGKGAAG